MVIVGDAVAIALGTLTALVVAGEVGNRRAEIAVIVAVAVATGVWAVRSQGLWLRRACAMRVIEIARLTRASIVFAVVFVAAERVARFSLRVLEVGAVVVTCWLLLVSWRTGVRLWLRAQHRRGRGLRRVMIIGTDERAGVLIDALNHDPDGMTMVIGAVGPEPTAPLPGLISASTPWLGGYDTAIAVIDNIDPDVVVLSARLGSTRAQSIVSHQHAAGRDILIDPDLSSFNLRSVEVVPVAYESLVHVQGVRLARLSMAMKSAFDIAVASTLIVLTSPLLALIALAVKLDDGGPVLFRQSRVGRNGTLFPVYKFRTMVIDAEARLEELRQQNLRVGPLFKLDRDPRVTRVGRFLRDASLDELPQLFNVVRGHMSLVGPRPALPREVESFPEELRRREDVRPGITGLWQVEARDNSSFELYRRLDLYYVRNWSLTLDLTILVATVEQVLVRLIRLRSGAGEVGGSGEGPAKPDHSIIDGPVELVPAAGQLVS